MTSTLLLPCNALKILNLVLGQEKRHGTKKKNGNGTKQATCCLDKMNKCIRDQKKAQRTKKNDIWDKIKNDKLDKKNMDEGPRKVGPRKVRPRSLGARWVWGSEEW